MAAGMWFATGTSGGDLSMATLSAKIRYAAQPIMKIQQFCEVKEAFGKHQHDELIYDKISNILTGGTVLTEASTMPVSQYSILKGTLSINEFGVSIPFSGKVEALSKLSVNDTIVQTLKNDMAKALDQAAYDQFIASDVTYTIRGTASGVWGTTGVLVADNTAKEDLNAYHVREIITWMKQHDYPTYDGQDYVCIASPAAVKGLFADSGWQDAYKYTKPENMWAGEIGRYFGCRFVEETHLLSNILGGTSGTNGSYGAALFFGKDAVAYGIATPPELRIKEITDYGRSKGVAWYGILGFHKTWDYTSDGEGRIVYLTCGTGT